MQVFFHHETPFSKWTYGPLFYQALHSVAGLVGKIREMSKTFREELIARLNVAQGRSGFLGVLAYMCLGSRIGGRGRQEPLWRGHDAAL